jgi:hypothetical protein
MLLLLLGDNPIGIKGNFKGDLESDITTSLVSLNDASCNTVCAFTSTEDLGNKFFFDSDNLYKVFLNLNNYLANVHFLKQIRYA